MKHIVLFSGGLSSSYVAYLVIKEFGHKDVVLLHTPTFSENHDADTFRCQVARYLKHPITEWGDGRDVWELSEDNHCIPGQFIPFCTQQLKQKMKEEYYKYLKEQGENFIEYIGFGTDEYRRVQKAYARNEKLGRKVRFPIFEKKISSEEIRNIIQNEWKIKIPSAYEHLTHNNCVPCFKAGKKSWRVYWEYNRKEFNKAKELEKKIGHTVFKNISLEELEKIFKNDKEWEDMQLSFSLDDLLPCECCN